MSRHRRTARLRADGLRNVATAAAVASGALAVVTPAVGLDDLGDAAGESTGAFLLAAENSSTAAAATASSGPRTEPVLAGADELVKASGLLEAAGGAGQAVVAERGRIEQAARAAAARPAGGGGGGGDDGESEAPAGGGPSSASCDIDTSGLGDVKSWVSDAAQFLGCAYDQPELLGVGNRGNASDHPTGHALDLMVRGEKGDRIAECALANADELGVKYVIWEQRMNSGDGWESMEDRGGDTANHNDHVHISFDKSAGSGNPDLGRCA
ncbi:hypothetical protein EV383_5037 [Pseudonocardia sediminis]|uniref:ARB-07466-like C-terminal domain-containing protein n=1 Tax=Pseudonocardia sediminis TaxID=1397368 RepID=A0A4Q7V3S3_PSEST|nr:hypothetical protein [Pseudonocardia sediminis]RZT88101.1 hypothetical protein EV383_5037 [Pseudonocardia sediminis]